MFGNKWGCRSGSWLLAGVCGAVVSPVEGAGADLVLEPVTVTGSRLRGPQSASLVPVSVWTRAEIDRLGVQSVMEAVDRLSMNNGGGFAYALGVGDVDHPGFVGASLRGLGSSATLVLLNGRRLAPYAFEGGSVSLSDIPLEIVDRIEVLRDGASALYGSDAVAGVINLITVDEFSGGKAAWSFGKTEHGGGMRRSASVTLGTGRLAEEGFNFSISAGITTQEPVRASQRSYARSAYVPELGVDWTSWMSNPANFYITTPSASGMYSPGAPAYGGRCAPPQSIALSSADTACVYDYASVIDILPESRREHVVMRGSKMWGDAQRLNLEWSRTQILTTYRLAPTVAEGLNLPASSPFYPRGWLQANFPEAVGQPLSTYYRVSEAGLRESQVRSTQDRVVLSGEGRTGAVDYRAGLWHAESHAQERYASGYLSASRFTSAFESGVINPLGANDATGLAAIEAAQLRSVARTARTTLSGADAHGVTELGGWRAGPIRLVFGADVQRSTFRDHPQSMLTQAQVLGGTTMQPAEGDRLVRAGFLELGVPWSSSLSTQFSLRRDSYSDVGGTTNPRLAARWQASDAWALRGSIGTAFRAPSLAQMHQPLGSSWTYGFYDDPFYNASTGCAASANANYCGRQMVVMAGGNAQVRPEKSTSLSIGTILTPSRGVTLTVDAFRIHQRDLIDIVSADAKLQDYIDHFDPATGTSSGRWSQDVVTRVDPATGQTVIDHVRQTWGNQGERMTTGFDWDLAWRLPPQPIGSFDLRWRGTYVAAMKSRDGGDWGDNEVNTYSLLGPVLRLKHRIELGWAAGPWGSVVAYNRQSGYSDYDPTTHARVEPFATFDVSMSHQRPKGAKLRLSVINLTDTRPGRSNQGSYFQVGYDPSNTNPLGRMYTVSAEYPFH